MQEAMLNRDLKEESKVSLTSLEEEGGEIRFKGSRKKNMVHLLGEQGVQIWPERWEQE